MQKIKNNNPVKVLLLISYLFLFSIISFSQTIDTTHKHFTFSGFAGITNNGISIIPTFSLSKPALVTNFSLAKGKFSFEPALSFSLEGKPWQFLFWFRYKMIDHKKFQMRIGAHPAFSYVNEIIMSDSLQRTHLVAQHYAAFELVPNFSVSKNISIGIYYLYGRGLQKDALRYSHFITLNSNFSKVKLSKKFYLDITPQVYYLAVTSQEGIYYSTNVTLNKQKFPLSFSLFANAKIKSNIAGSKNFLWNATLTYAF